MRVAYIGVDVATALFPAGAETALNQEISIARVYPIALSVWPLAKGTVFGVPQDNFITLPLKTYGNNFGGFTRNRLLYFVATSRTDETFSDAVEEARFLMRTRRKLKSDEKDNFGIVTPGRDYRVPRSFVRSYLFGRRRSSRIAMVVGAIVIMNIMLVSVTERTKEIGVSKSLGARKMDILKQFLVEAITLSTIGGADGNCSWRGLSAHGDDFI